MDPQEQLQDASKRLGENGHLELTAEGLGDALLAFFDKLSRGLAEERIRSFTSDVLTEAHAKGDPEMVKNLFVLAFHTRWCRGGKGERKIFYHLLAVLFETYPNVVLRLVPLMPHYGYWKDGLSLLLQCNQAGVDYAPLRSKVWGEFARQLQADSDELDAAAREKRHPNLSLAAKFAPTEGCFHSKKLHADKEICKLLFPRLVGPHVAPGDAAWLTARAKYRRMLSSLRKALAVPEVHMCAQEFAEIEFSKVSSLCLARNKRAFLNEGKGRNAEKCDRQACRQHLLDLITEKGVAAPKGKQLFPHELVQQVLKNSKDGLSAGVSAVLNVQWEAVRNGLLEMVAERKAEVAEAGDLLDNVEALKLASAACPGHGALSVATDVAIDAAVSSGASKPVGLSRVVPMADVSGSMAGTPMFVSIAMGILASEVTHPAFRDQVLTFDSVPVWHDLSTRDGLHKATFVEKVQSLSHAPWGGSTDFWKAMKMIADLVKTHRLEQHEIPDLLVISDMQFDEASASNALPFDKIVDMFRQVGMFLHGHELKPPGIIFWNVRSDTVGYPAAADQPGVMLLSGFSPALMKFILSGEMVGEKIEADGTKVRAQVDPPNPKPQTPNPTP